MQTLENQRALVTGGSRGLGLGVVEALQARGAEVTVVARDGARLQELASRAGVRVIPGDAADPEVAAPVLARVRPTALVLNAGATPVLAPFDQQTWDTFSEAWRVDVRASFHWVQASLAARARQPGAAHLQRRSPRGLTALRDHVVTVLTEHASTAAIAFGIHGETGVQPLGG